ncbi:MAG: hypothetical protein ACP5SI_04275 [Chloroflexia bacterium]
MAQEALLERILATAGVEPILRTPEGVEARLRVNLAGQETLLIINHRRTPATVRLPWLVYDHLRGSLMGNTPSLNSYDVSVLTRVATSRTAGCQEPEPMVEYTDGQAQLGNLCA